MLDLHVGIIKYGVIKDRIKKVSKKSQKLILIIIYSRSKMGIIFNKRALPAKIEH